MVCECQCFLYKFWATCWPPLAHLLAGTQPFLPSGLSERGGKAVATCPPPRPWSGSLQVARSLVEGGHPHFLCSLAYRRGRKVVAFPPPPDWVMLQHISGRWKGYGGAGDWLTTGIMSNSRWGATTACPPWLRACSQPTNLTYSYMGYVNQPSVANHQLSQCCVILTIIWLVKIFLNFILPFSLRLKADCTVRTMESSSMRQY